MEMNFQQKKIEMKEKTCGYWILVDCVNRTRQSTEMGT